MGQLEDATIMVKECGGLHQIEQLQKHENGEVCHKALELVEKYFSEGVSIFFKFFADLF